MALINADALQIPLSDQSVHCVITSPPYWALRDYDVDGQLGLEPTPETYIETMIDVFREIWRVLRDDGTLWLNLGDTYANDTKWGGKSGNINYTSVRGGYDHCRSRRQSGRRPKSLIGIPWMVALALQQDGWILRSDIIWHKSNCMPESVTDRPTKAHEYVFLLTKQPHYYYDAAAIREVSVRGWAGGKFDTDRQAASKSKMLSPVGASQRIETTGRNKRSVWDVPTAGVKEAHFATFPPKLIEPMILAGTSAYGVCADCGTPWRRITEKTFHPQPDVSPARRVKGANGQKPMAPENRWEGTPRGSNRIDTTGWNATCDCDCPEVVPATILDPFVGSGTTIMVARQKSRRGIGIDLSYPYISEIAQRRVCGPFQMEMFT